MTGDKRLQAAMPPIETFLFVIAYISLESILQ